MSMQRATAMKPATRPAPTTLLAGFVQRMCTTCTEAADHDENKGTAFPSHSLAATPPLPQRTLPIGEPGDAFAPKAHVIQRQSDAARPEEIEEEPAEEPESEMEVVAAGGGGEGSDTGEGVASVEEGQPFMTTGTVEAEEEAEEEPEGNDEAAVQTKSAAGSRTGSARRSPVTILRSLGAGADMDGTLRQGMSAAFGESFSGVRVHTGGRADLLARSLGAHAFTIGRDIAFAAGRYRPETTEGLRVIAHELTHVVQQRHGLSGGILKTGIGAPGDRYEREADRVADRVIAQGRAPRVGLASGGGPGALGSHPSRREAAGGVVQLYSGSTAASYAKKWANSTNSAYGRFSNDCTNFVSQCMEAGGWKMVVGGGYCDDRRKNSVWWFKKDGCTYWWRSNVHASHTWGGAENFFQFAKASGRGTLAKRVWDLDVGDVLQADWDSNGNINHTMIVTKKTKSNLYLTFHTSDTLDEPFWAEGKNKGIVGRNPTPPASYYAWKM